MGGRDDHGGSAGRPHPLTAVRVVHPFPSLVDGGVTAGIALVAAGDPLVALRLGVAMTCLQFAIGALNDLADADADHGRPEKPVPAGLVPRRVAAAIVLGGLIFGLVLTLPSGWPTVAIAASGTAVGFAYDLWLKRTAWSWLAYAVALPLLPVYAWLGAAGSLPPLFLAVVPLAVLAGAAVALANGLVHPSLDAAAGVRTLVVNLGAPAARRLLGGLVGATVALAAGSLAMVGGSGPGVLLAGSALVPLVAGWVALDGADAPHRERGWELTALGLGLLGVGWLWAAWSAGA